MIGDSKFDAVYKDCAKRVFGNYSGQTARLVDDIALGFFKIHGEESCRKRYDLEGLFDLLKDLRICLNPLSGCESDEVKESRFKDLKDRLGHLAQQDYKQIVWLYPSAKYGLEEKKPSFNGWNFSIDHLDDIAETYHQNYWGYSPEIERILISAFTYHESYNFGLIIKPKLVLKASDKAAIIRLIKLSVLSLIKLGVLFYVWASIKDSYGESLALFAALMLYIADAINTRIKYRHEYLDEKEKVNLYLDMIDVAEHSRLKFMPPDHIYKLLIQTKSNGAVWRPITFALLSSASKTWQPNHAHQSKNNSY